jgi:peptidoglycan hydrolase CwlO-like protein
MRNKKVFVIVIVFVICFVAGRFAISVTDRNHYSEHYSDNDNWITTPPYQTDATRAIDAYERLMERYMDSMDEHLSHLNSDNQAIIQQLTSVNTKLDDLSSRISRIEKALGIDPNSSTPSKSKPSKK